MTPKQERIIVEIVAWICSAIIIGAVFYLIW